MSLESTILTAAHSRSTQTLLMSLQTQTAVCPPQKPTRINLFKRHCSVSVAPFSPTSPFPHLKGCFPLNLRFGFSCMILFGLHHPALLLEHLHVFTIIQRQHVKRHEAQTIPNRCRVLAHGTPSKQAGFTGNPGCQSHEPYSMIFTCWLFCCLSKSTKSESSAEIRNETLKSRKSLTLSNLLFLIHLLSVFTDQHKLSELLPLTEPCTAEGLVDILDIFVLVQDLKVSAYSVI